MGRGADAVVRMVPSISPAALRAALSRMSDAGADEVLLVPTTTDLDELRRLEDVIG
jgi:hypothetical protein